MTLYNLWLGDKLGYTRGAIYIFKSLNSCYCVSSAVRQLAGAFDSELKKFSILTTSGPSSHTHIHNCICMLSIADLIFIPCLN